MSFNLDQILKENYWIIEKIKNRESEERAINWILGECIANDIMSDTCECKRSWNTFDREQMKKEIKNRIIEENGEW